MTPEWCVGKCKLAGYKYAGLQYGYLCFCGDRFGTYGKVDDAECDSLCFGDKTRYCGAFWHNSIFSVGKSSTRNEKVLSCSITQNKFPIQTCNMNSRKRKINATNIPKKNFPHSNTLWSFFFLWPRSRKAWTTCERRARRARRQWIRRICGRARRQIWLVFKSEF